MQRLAAQYNDKFGVGTCTHACSLGSHISSEQVFTTIAILIVHSFQSLDLDDKSQLIGMQILASQSDKRFGVGTWTLACSVHSHISSEQVLFNIAISEHIFILPATLSVHSFRSLDLDHKSQLSGMDMLAAQYKDKFGVGT